MSFLNKPPRGTKLETLNQNKPYDEWTNIREGFAELYNQLNLDDPTSKVDKAVEHILDQNIPVRHLNIMYKNKTTVQRQKRLIFWSKFQEFSFTLCKLFWSNFGE